jgi:hypothetical protein
MKAMSRSRAQRDHMARFPRRHVQEYRDSWERELFGGLHGKPWVWDDVVRKIVMAERHRSMHRMFIAFGEIERLCQERSFGQAQLQAVQSMKAIHQFTLDGHWKTAWRMTGLAYPFYKRRVGATYREMECILGELKVEDDIEKRAKGVLTKDKDKDDG